MFTSLSYLRKHTPQNGTDRESYLSLLVDEYIHSTSYDAKCQVLANLANFSYDPLNFGYIRDVGVLDIFVHVMKNETDSKLLNYATTGICNLSPDPLNIKYLIEHDALQSLKELLKSQHNEIVSDVLTTFIYLYEETKHTIKDIEIIHQVQILKESDNKIISNIAAILLEHTLELK